MAQLIFRCPYTNKPICSGIELDRRNVGAVGDYPVSVHCPHCNVVHHGMMSHGQLGEDLTEPADESE